MPLVLVCRRGRGGGLFSLRHSSYHSCFLFCLEKIVKINVNTCLHTLLYISHFNRRCCSEGSSFSPYHTHDHSPRPLFSIFFSWMIVEQLLVAAAATAVMETGWLFVSFAATGGSVHSMTNRVISKRASSGKRHNTPSTKHIDISTIRMCACSPYPRQNPTHRRFGT